MKNVLDGFIGTYTSRYSDFRGYWLHGQLPFDTSEYNVDLLAKPAEKDGPETMAQILAIRKFKEQLVKSGLESGLVCFAHLKIKMQSKVVEGWHGDHLNDGHMVEFVATAVMDDGSKYERTRVVFVAPHDSRKERRRLPEDWGT